MHPPSPPTIRSQETRGAPRGLLRPRSPSQEQQEGGSGEEQRPLHQEGHLFTPWECAQFWAFFRGDFRADAVPHQEGLLSGRPKGEFLRSLYLPRCLNQRFMWTLKAAVIHV